MTLRKQFPQTNPLVIVDENIDLEKRMAETIGVTVKDPVLKKNKTIPKPDHNLVQSNDIDTTPSESDSASDDERNLIIHQPYNDLPTKGEHSEPPIEHHSHIVDVDTSEELKTAMEEDVIVAIHNNTQNHAIDKDLPEQEPELSIEETAESTSDNPIEEELTPIKNVGIYSNSKESMEEIPAKKTDSGISDTNELGDDASVTSESPSNTSHPEYGQDPSEDDNTEIMELTQMPLPTVTSHRSHSPQFWVS